MNMVRSSTIVGKATVATVCRPMYIKYPFDEPKHFNNYYFANFSSIFLAYKLLFFNPFYSMYLVNECMKHSYVCFASSFGLFQASESIFFPFFGFIAWCCCCCCVQHTNASKMYDAGNRK